jgi:hypothetical protein
MFLDTNSEAFKNFIVFCKSDVLTWYSSTKAKVNSMGKQKKCVVEWGIQNLRKSKPSVIARVSGRKQVVSEVCQHTLIPMLVSLNLFSLFSHDKNFADLQFF